MQRASPRPALHRQAERSLAKPLPRCRLRIQPHPSCEIIIAIAITRYRPTLNQPPPSQGSVCTEGDTARGRVTDEGEHSGGAWQGHPRETSPSVLPVTPRRRRSRERCDAIAAVPETLTALLIKLLGSAVKSCRPAAASRSHTRSSAQGTSLMPFSCCQAHGQAGGSTCPPDTVPRPSTSHVRSCCAAGAWQGACRSGLSPSPRINLKRVFVRLGRSGARRVRTPNIILKAQAAFCPGAPCQDIPLGRCVRTERAHRCREMFFADVSWSVIHPFQTSQCIRALTSLLRLACG